MSVLNVKPIFLYPFSRRYPFDEVAEKIVKALQGRNFNVPGIEVDFYTFGSGESKYKMIGEIKGENFKLIFSRNQGKLNEQYDNVAALSTIYIPKQIVRVYSHEVAPSYYLYVGNNWERDKNWFMNSPKACAKLNNKMRRYLKYKLNLGRCKPVELICDTDFGREYSPMGNEPHRINLEDKFYEFTRWLEKNVLDYILSFPEAYEIEDNIKLIPYEGPWPIVYSVCNISDKTRLLAGIRNPSDLAPEDRHAFFGNGTTLIRVVHKGRCPDEAYDGFIWCDTNQNIAQYSRMSKVSFDVRTTMNGFNIAGSIVAIKPKYANGLYVVDNTKYKEIRKGISKRTGKRISFTDKEMDMASVSRACTLIPINEYKGNYKEPILLISRELDFDEIEWIADSN